MRYESDDDYQAQEGNTQEGTYVVRRTKEYSCPDSDEDSVDPNTNPPIPIDTLTTEPEQTPLLATPPVPSFAATEGEEHNPAPLDDGYDTDWRYYPEYEPLFQLIPKGFRPLTETEEAIRAGYNYDSEKSDHSEDPPHGYTRYVPRTLRGSRAGRVPSLPSPRRCKMIPPIRHRRRGDLPHPPPAAPQ